MCFHAARCVPTVIFVFSRCTQRPYYLFFKSVVVFFFLLRRYRFLWYLGVGQVGEDAGEGDAWTEVDACLLDEGRIVFLFGQGTLAAHTDLEGAQVAQTDNLAGLQSIDDYIFHGYQYGIDIGLGHGLEKVSRVRHLSLFERAPAAYVSGATFLS